MIDDEYWTRLPDRIERGTRIMLKEVELVAVPCGPKAKLGCSQCYFGSRDGCNDVPCPNIIWATPFNAVVLSLER